MEEVWNWVIFFLILIALSVMIIYQVEFHSLILIFWCNSVVFMLFMRHLVLHNWQKE